MFNLPSVAIAIKTRDEDSKYIGKQEIEKNKKLYDDVAQIQKDLGARIQRELHGKRG